MGSDLFAGLSASFEGRPVLDNFTLDLPDRGVFCLHGPSGCGKTTFLRAVCARLLRTTRPLGYVFQEDRLFPQLTALQNAVVSGASPALAKELLCALGLRGSLGLLPAELSGGMRRRVALARALAAVSGQPDGVLLLDEPFTGLDENNKALSAALVAAHRPGLVLLVTHDLQEAAALGAQVFAVQGPPLEVAAN